MNTELVDWKELKKVVLYSRQHIKRLEDEGKFPRRVPLGPHRVAWVRSEIIEWLSSRLRIRDEQAP